MYTDEEGEDEGGAHCSLNDDDHRLTHEGTHFYNFHLAVYFLTACSDFITLFLAKNVSPFWENQNVINSLADNNVQ